MHSNVWDGSIGLVNSQSKYPLITAGDMMDLTFSMKELDQWI